MSALAAVTLRRQGAPSLLVTYADAVAGLPIGPDGKRQRRNAAARLLAICPAPEQWMARPTPARLADIHRTGAWTFLAWCFTEGHLRPDLDLLLAKLPGSLYQAWAALHRGDMDHPGNLGGSDSWEDAGPWRHRGSIQMSSASAR
jgi:hypothetical protein